METGSFSLIRSHDADVAEIALAEIEAHIVPDEQTEPLQRRLVEAELLFQTGDECRIQAPARRDISNCPPKAKLILALTEISTATADAVHGIAALAGELADNPLYGPAGHELHNDEADKQDPEKCRDHQNQATEDIGSHQELPLNAAINIKPYQLPLPLLRRATRASQPENHNRVLAP